MQRVGLILSISVRAAGHQNDLLEGLWLDQELEEALILAEFGKYLASVESHVQIVAILEGQLVDERVHDHRALFFQHLLHALLLRCQLLLSLVRVKV